MLSSACSATASGFPMLRAGFNLALENLENPKLFNILPARLPASEGSRPALKCGQNGFWPRIGLLWHTPKVTRCSSNRTWQGRICAHMLLMLWTSRRWCKCVRYHWMSNSCEKEMCFTKNVVWWCLVRVGQTQLSLLYIADFPYTLIILTFAESKWFQTKLENPQPLFLLESQERSVCTLALKI